VRERTSREVRAEVIEDDSLAVPLLIPRQKGETELAIKETTIAGRRYVISSTGVGPHHERPRHATNMPKIGRPPPSIAVCLNRRRKSVRLPSSLRPSCRQPCVKTMTIGF
jgi:hypothetical protein